MDRFSSHEEAPEWTPEHFEAGRSAHLTGAGRDSAPPASKIGEFGRKSWLAGWTDAEMGILADTEVALQNGSLTTQDDELVAAVSRLADQE